MRHLLATLALGPLLLLQGKYVRRVTPKLPEPPGARQGESGNGPPLRLLILGDSAAAGVGAATQAEALSGQLVAALHGDFRVQWKLLARTGSTTPETLQHMRSAAREPFDVVVISLGVNDVTANRAPASWLRSKMELVQLLQREYAAGLVLLSELPPMHRFPALPQPLRWYLGVQARRYNRVLAGFAATQAGCRLESVALPPQGEALVASDGFHPGAGFYRLWGQHLAQSVRQNWPSVRV
ncbi:MAG: SGNH/GDSL hydrolase family protein [Chitinivorax sp.]